MEEVKTVRGFIDQWCRLNEEYRNRLNEEAGGDGIPYKSDDIVYQSITSVCTEMFGAKFDANPVIYDPQEENILVNGHIGGFENAHFSFRLNDNSGNGCYVWFDNLQLNDTNLRKLQVIYSVYNNWKKEVLSMPDYKPSNYTQN